MNKRNFQPSRSDRNSEEAPVQITTVTSSDTGQSMGCESMCAVISYLNEIMTPCRKGSKKERKRIRILANSFVPLCNCDSWNKKETTIPVHFTSYSKQTGNIFLQVEANSWKYSDFVLKTWSFLLSAIKLTAGPHWVLQGPQGVAAQQQMDGVTYRNMLKLSSV